MAVTFQIKRRDVNDANGAGAPSSLKQGELAFNEVDQTLYYGLGYNSGTTNANSIVEIGGKGYVEDLSGVYALLEASNDFRDSLAPTTNQFDAITATATVTAAGNIVSTTGNITASAGSLTAGAGISAASAKFGVDGATGNVVTQGNVTGVNLDFSGNAEVDGTLKAANNTGTFRFTVNGTGATTVASLSSEGDIVSATGKIEATNGGLVGQTLDIAGVTAITAAGDITVTSGVTTTFSVAGATGDTNIEGSLDVTGDATIGENASLSLPMLTVDSTNEEVNVSGDVNITGNIYAGVKAYANSKELATKDYVDSVKQGLDVKESVRFATTSSDLNLSLSGAATVDSATPADGDRILVKNQNASPNTNGIYIYSSTGAWVRAEDANTSAEVTPGLFTFVEEGVENADTGWVLTTNQTITLGTTNLAFTQFSGAGQVGDGDALSKQGSTLNVNVDEDTVNQTGTIGILNDKLRVSQFYSGQTSIETLGDINTGVWKATDIAIDHGGTGASTKSGARGNLEVPGDADDNIFTGQNTFRKNTGTFFEQSSGGDQIVIKAHANNNGYAATLTTDALTASHTHTLPNASGTVLLDSTLCAALNNPATTCLLDGGEF